MINYLEKFNNLPPAIKEAISSEEAMAAIAEIENKYDISLATVVMRVVVKDISILDLSKYFVFEHEMDGKRAEELVEDLKENLFYAIADYLGYSSEKKAPSELERRIKSEINDDIKVAASSNFFFSSEDEEEVSALAKKVQGFVSKDDLNRQKEELSRQMDRKLSVILNQLTIQFSSVDMTNRFKYVISSYLRGIRNRIDTRDVLKKDIDNGGLELDDILVDKVLGIVDKVNSEDIKSEELKQPPRINVPEDEMQSKNKDDKGSLISGSDSGLQSKSDTPSGLKLSAIRDVEYDFSKFAEANKNTANEKPKIEVEEPAKENRPVDLPKENKLDGQSPIIDLSSRERLASILGEAQKKGGEKKQSGRLDLKDVLDGADLVDEAPAKKEVDSKINIVNVRQPSSDSGRKRMEDVKYVPKLTGPIDELGEMTLVDYRRLSHDPNVSANKISEKIVFLEEESYSQRLAGIKAWRQSPVNKLYLQIGQESINDKIGVDQVIERRRNEGQDFLTNEEFAAIMDLNKDLRF